MTEEVQAIFAVKQKNNANLRVHRGYDDKGRNKGYFHFTGSSLILRKEPEIKEMRELLEQPSVNSLCQEIDIAAAEAIALQAQRTLAAQRPAGVKGAFTAGDLQRLKEANPEADVLEALRAQGLSDDQINQKMAELRELGMIVAENVQPPKASAPSGEGFKPDNPEAFEKAAVMAAEAGQEVPEEKKPGQISLGNKT